MNYRLHPSMEEHIKDSIAVIGMAGRFPGAESVEAFWRNICIGRECITQFEDDQLDRSIDPDVIKDPNYVKSNFVLENVDRFDASFFGISPLEASVMDPQQRIFLEVAWQALESAGYDPENYVDKEGGISVFAGAGVSLDNYFLKNVRFYPGKMQLLGNMSTMLGNEKDFLCTRTSYKLNLTGQSVCLGTACSTSLVGICHAVDSLLNYQSYMALAGGVSIQFPQNAGYLYQDGLILSKDGHCRPFSSDANGTVRAAGCALVVLKRLEDALRDRDHIWAVVRGTGMNNDGANKMNFTSPSITGQCAAILNAIDSANIDPRTIGYVEAHGTGTFVGDPIEIEGLRRAFQKRFPKGAKRENQYCAIGSVKANVGHLDAAAGVTGFIKAALCLHQKKLVPSINFKEANPQLDLKNSPFYVNTDLKDWNPEGMPRRAGVSSFGLGGTNAHVILEEAPERIKKPTSQMDSPSIQLLTISAKSSEALDNATQRLGEFFKSHYECDINDVSWTLSKRRSFEHRRYLVSSDSNQAADKILSGSLKKAIARQHCPVAFVFPGQGSQHINMGLEIYKKMAVFRDAVDTCAVVLEPHIGVDIRTIFFPHKEDSERASERLKQTAMAQPALFVVEYSLARLLMDLGVMPTAMTGHSIGEYTAACLSGVFTLEDALHVVAKRGTMMQSLPKGSMLSVGTSSEHLDTLLMEGVSIAAVNAPKLCVVSGADDKINLLCDALTSKDIPCTKLHTSHAFHSDMMSPIVKPFADFLAGINLKKPIIPFVSTMTGTWITDEQACDAEYWALHLRNAVRFSDAIETIWEDEEMRLLEVGPRRVTTTLAKKHQGHSRKRVACASLDDPTADSEYESFLLALGALWSSGADVDFDKLYPDKRAYRTALPTYPFESKRFWLSAPAFTENIVEKTAMLEPHESLVERDGCQQETCFSENNPSRNQRTDMVNRLVTIIQTFSGLDRDHIDADISFVELGLDSLVLVQVLAAINQIFRLSLSLQNIVRDYSSVTRLCNYIQELYSDSTVGSLADVLYQRPNIEIKRSLYFGSNKELYGIYHAPEIVSRDTGVLFCYPIGDEYIRSHGAFKILEEALVAQGFPVFKFDYFGTGDSLSSSDDWNIDIWRENVVSAATELLKMSQVPNISIVSLRYGSLLAASAVSEGLKVKDLVFWDPVLDGTSFLDQLIYIHRCQIETFINNFPFPSEEDLCLDPNELIGFYYSPNLRNAMKEDTFTRFEYNNCSKIHLIASEENKSYLSLRAIIEAKKNNVLAKIVEDETGYWEDPQALAIRVFMPSTILKAIMKSLMGEME